MRVSPHAIQRYRERVEADVTDEQARMLILEIVEHGHPPAHQDWARFKVSHEPQKHYFIHRRIMAIQEADCILTVLRPPPQQYRLKHRKPDYRRMRGMTVQKFLEDFDE